MPTHRTPGVFVEEISTFQPSVAPVETAIPAFVGFTETATDDAGESLINLPTRIASLVEFEEKFGRAPLHTFDVDVTQTAAGPIVEYDGDPPVLPDFFLHYSMQLFYANGGGACYIVSAGDYDTFSQVALSSAFGQAFDALKAVDEPTILVFPDACLGTDTDLGDIVDAALMHCKEMGDRFAIIDVRNAVIGGTDTNAKVSTNFRNEIASDSILLKNGAAYFPYVETSIPFHTNDQNILVKSNTGGSTSVQPDTPISDPSVKEAEPAVYRAVKKFVGKANVTIPPSGGIAGVYVRTDIDRGVWKAPANASLIDVSRPAIQVGDDMGEELNVDVASGKSVNAIRSFAGRGTLVWGARTLAGNDNENRYVPVRRFLIMAEESIKNATERFVFEPNDSSTWSRVASMIESFLTMQWRSGALQGAKPEDAFFVSVGLGKTMTPLDILQGRLIVHIGLALVRPAEFIILKIIHKMAEA